MKDFTHLLVDVAENYANSRGYEFSDEFKDFLGGLIFNSEASFQGDFREAPVKMDLARRNVEFIIDRIIQKLPPEDGTVIPMHEWIHGIKDWICPLFPFC